AVIIDNECRDNVTAGIGVREKASALIVDNRCLENKTVAIGVRNGSDAWIARNQLVRTGGMPPMIAIREGSSSVVMGNTIRGGGVAGVMVQGTATISGNQFEGNGPRGGPGPPNFAAWVHGGSTVSFSSNRSDRWRHALFASGAKQVRATDNTASQFLGTAIVVDKSELPAHVFGNVAISDNSEDEAVKVTGAQGVVLENSRKAADRKNEASGSRTTKSR
ncbi:MAG: right-handed parallel beta-helix repeat-containing protein, partial [Planctomycetaceae bacterium]